MLKCLPWLNIIGLILNLVGTLCLAIGVIVSKKRALDSISGWLSYHEEENLRMPVVQDRIRQSRNTIIGLVFLAIGFVLQCIGSWPR